MKRKPKPIRKKPGRVAKSGVKRNSLTTGERISKSNNEKAFREFIELIEEARQHAYHVVNTTLIELYSHIGERISYRITTDGWGKSTISSLANFIRQEQPNVRGFSAQNLWRMRQFFETYRETSILSPLVRELPWTHNLAILSRAKRPEEREFYLRLAIREKWSKRELERQLNSALFERTVLSPPKVSALLTQLHPAAETIFKDAYFLELSPTVRSTDLQSVGQAVVPTAAFGTPVGTTRSHTDCKSVLRLAARLLLSPTIFGAGQN